MQVDKKPIYARLGKNLKRIRLEKGLSQGDIARRIEADRSYVSGIENGKRNITLATIEKLAKALGVGSDDLMK